MVLGDGIRRNLADVDPTERKLLIDAIKTLNQKYYPGSRNETPPGGVTWWFKQDEIHQATHVHNGPEFLPWHRELINYFEGLIRQINPQLSLHYWDFKQDPRHIPDAKLEGGTKGVLNLFEDKFMGKVSGPIEEPWFSAKFYDPEAGKPGHPLNRDDSTPTNPADPPSMVRRIPFYPPGAPPKPLTDETEENSILALDQYGDGSNSPINFRVALEGLHNRAHDYALGKDKLELRHVSFRDPFVYLLHSNVDRIFAMWQCDPKHPERLDPKTVYGAESSLDVAVFTIGGVVNQNLTNPVEPFSTGHGQFSVIRPWESTFEKQGFPHDYHHISVVAPPCYDTLPTTVRVLEAENPNNIINFREVPQGETASRAAVFHVFACDLVTLKVKPGSGPNAPYSIRTPPGDTVPVPPGAHGLQVARIWFQYTAAAPGPAPNGSVTILCLETNQEFTFTIHGSSIPRPTVAVMLVLDQSGSMGRLAGVDATTKRIDVLHQAATNFCQLIQPNNAVGMVSFDHLACPGFDVTTFTGAPSDAAKLLTMVQAINNLKPQGATSIGKGIVLGRNKLNAVTTFDKTAMIVFTDGVENFDLRIADVGGSLDAQTFAIGLGTAHEVSAGALDAITHNTGGYMLLSGPLSPAIDDEFRLQKYFLQVLAGVSNTSIVTDPSGTIFPGMKIRIPFQLSEADISVTAILLTNRRGVDFLVETPSGSVMTPGSAGGLGATYGIGNNMNYYRFTLPLPLGTTPARAGTWYAILTMAGKDIPRVPSSASHGPGIHYSFSAHAFTNIRMDARLSQNSLQPGANITISATLTEYGTPVIQRANVHAEVERPDNTRETLVLAEDDSGRFLVSMIAVVPGVYRIRVVASGVTMRQVPFTREQLLSATAIPGGDRPPPTSGPSTSRHDKDLCNLVECLLRPEALGRLLEQHKVNPKAVLGCVEKWCKARAAGPTKEELAELEGTA